MGNDWFGGPLLEAAAPHVSGRRRDDDHIHCRAGEKAGADGDTEANGDGDDDAHRVARDTVDVLWMNRGTSRRSVFATAVSTLPLADDGNVPAAGAELGDGPAIGVGGNRTGENVGVGGAVYGYR